MVYNFKGILASPSTQTMKLYLAVAVLLLALIAYAGQY